MTTSSYSRRSRAEGRWVPQPASRVRRGDTVDLDRGEPLLVVRAARHGDEVMLEVWHREFVEHERVFLQHGATVRVLDQGADAVPLSDDSGCWAGEPWTALQSWPADPGADGHGPELHGITDDQISRLLLSGIAAQEASELDAPHILVCDYGRGLPRAYIGPFPDAASALFAGSCEERRFAEELPGNPVTIRIAPLLPDPEGDQ